MDRAADESELRVRAMPERRDRLLDWIGHLLCRFGVHDYRLIEAIGGKVSERGSASGVVVESAVTSPM